MKSQLIQSRYGDDADTELYLVELDNGRKIEVEIYDEHFEGNPGENDSHYLERVRITEVDSKRSFTYLYNELAEKLIQAFQERGVKEIRRMECPIKSEPVETEGLIFLA